MRTKLAVAEAAAALDPQYERNVDGAARGAAARTCRPSDITARLGAPWIPTDVIEAFARRGDGHRGRGSGTPRRSPPGPSTARGFAGTAAGTSEWGTARRHAGQLLHDALNSATPQIYDIDGRATASRSRVLNVEATEAAKEKLLKIKTAFTALGLDRPRPRRPARPDLQRPLQQPGAAALRRPPPDAAGRQQHHPALRRTRSG